MRLEDSAIHATSKAVPPAQLQARLWARAAEPLFGAALILILALGLWMRTANLMNVQAFNGDQGRDYLVIMDWFQHGRWPLLGPDRAAVGDHTLGPAWFYTIAPAMVLGRFHPAAGAITVAVAAILAIALMAAWVRRASASRAAALVTAAVMAFGTIWTEQQRTVWNPNVLPLGVAALAWLIECLPRRPVPCLAAALALLALLPQWHTTGLLVDAAAAVPLAWAAWRALPAARRTGWRTWTACSLILALFIALLYVPPLIYELRPGPGNLVSYFTGAVLPADPFEGGWLRKAWMAFDKLIGATAFQAFLIDPANMNPFALSARLAAGLAGLIAFMLIFLGDLFHPQLTTQNSQPIPHSAFFLALLSGGFWLVLTLKGRGVPDYCLKAPETALLMLGGWTAGRLLTAPAVAGSRLRPKMMAGTALLLAAGALCLAQAPRAWAVHEGMTPYRFTFRVAREIAEAIARDSAGRPFSLELAEPYNFPAHYFYLLRWMGRPPLNEDYYAHAIPRDRMGERIYIIAAPGVAPEPALKGLAGPLTDSLQVRNVTIWRLDPARLPPATRELRIIAEGPQWMLEAAK